MDFDANIRGLDRYIRDLKDATKRIRIATSIYLTGLAIQGEEQAWEEIQNTQIVRSKKFIRSRLSHVAASRAQEPNRQRATMGSRSSPRFSAWREQETGGASKERVGMTLARGRTRRGKLKPSYRLKPGRYLPNPENTPIKHAKSAGHRAHIFLRMMSREKKVPFVLFGHWALPAGLWILEGRRGKGQWPRPRLLQAFHANTKIKRTRWMTHAIADLRRGFNAQNAWKLAWLRAAVTKR